VIPHDDGGCNTESGADSALDAAQIETIEAMATDVHQVMCASEPQ
jgi:hypothetical protein